VPTFQIAKNLQSFISQGNNDVTLQINYLDVNKKHKRGYNAKLR